MILFFFLSSWLREMTTLGINIKRNLKYINDNFIEATQRSVLLGNDYTGSGNNLINQFLDFNNFAINWLTTTVTFTGLNDLQKTENLLTNIFLKKDNAWVNANNFYSGASPTNKFTLETPAYTYNNDVTTINYTKLLSSIQKSSSTTLQKTQSQSETFASLLELLNAIRVTYNLLEPAKYKTYLEGSLTTVSMYELNDDNTDYKKFTNSAEDVETMRNLVNKFLINLDTLNVSITNVDALRRILLGYESMIHIYIAAHIYNNLQSTGFKNLLETNIAYLNKFNLNIFDSTTNEGLNVLYSGLEERIKTYKDSKNDINVLNENLQKAKSDIQIEKNYINSHSKFYNSNKNMFFIFTLLFLLLLIVLLANYYGILMVSEATSKKVPLIIAGIALLLLVILYVSHRTVLTEPFAATDLTTYTTLALKVFDEYINHTINIIRVLDTYRGYGDISYAIKKEKNYYTGLEFNLNQNKETLNSIQAENYRQGKILRYRTYLFLQILITLSIIIAIMMYAPGSLNTNIIYGVIGTFIILLWVYFYIFNINNLVRTDPRKLYWGQPSSELLS
jgi:hypothetical protein